MDTLPPCLLRPCLSVGGRGRQPSASRWRRSCCARLSAAGGLIRATPKAMATELPAALGWLPFHNRSSHGASRKRQEQVGVRSLAALRCGGVRPVTARGGSATHVARLATFAASARELCEVAGGLVPQLFRREAIDLFGFRRLARLGQSRFGDGCDPSASVEGWRAPFSSGCIARQVVGIIEIALGCHRVVG